MYRNWPHEIEPGIAVAALQPPGRENRRREEPVTDHHDFATRLADWIENQQFNDYMFFGHCGAATFMCSTIFELEDRGAPLPRHMVASGWGAPDRGLYGYLNFVDLDSFDFVAEVHRQAGRMGSTITEEIAQSAAKLLLHDQIIYRGYKYPAGRRIPVPVTVLVWQNDEVVPPEQISDSWDHVADVSYVDLPGRHFTFLECNARLQRVILQCHLKHELT